MSTSIDIKKRIIVEEEGSPITNEVNKINFTGDGVSASASGNDVTVNIPGAFGITTYYLNDTVAQAPYKEFSSTPTAAAEQTIVTNVAPATTVTLQSFQTPVGVPNTTNIPGGRWAFYIHLSGTLGDSWSIFAEVYLRDIGAVETLLLTTDVILTTSLTGTAAMFLTDGVFPTTTTLTTDRIVVKIKATNNDPVNNKTITFHTEGSTNYSIGTTTLNQVISGGSVTSVTGVAPVQSSGGTTPAISIPQATALVDGYLSAADWTLFSYNRQIQDEGVNVTQRTTVDFQGAGVSVADAGSKTVVTIPGTSFGKIGITNINGQYTYYATLSSAVAAAVAGDTIILFTNIIETGAVSVVLPSNVDINLNGYTYTLSNAGVNNAIETTVSGINHIFNGKISRQGGADNNTDSVALKLESASNVQLTGVIIDNQTGVGIYSAGAYLYGSWRIEGLRGIYGDTSGFEIYNGNIYTSGDAITVASATTIGFLHIFSTAGGGIIASDQLTIFDSTVFSLGGAAVNAGADLDMTKCTVRAFVGQGVVTASSSCIISSSDIIAYSSNALFVNNNAVSFTIIGNSFISFTNSTVRILCSQSGTFAKNDVRVNSSSAIVGLNIQASGVGSLVFVQSNNIYVVSANVPGVSHAALITNSGLTNFYVLTNILSVFSPNIGSRCLTASFATTMYYANNTFQNNVPVTPVGANVTQGMVNTPDLYGNTLIG